MQNNVYGTELDLKIDKFKSKMKEAQNISKEAGKKIADNTKFNVWENGVMTLSNGVQLVKKEEKQLNNEIEETGKVTQNTGNEISKAFNKGLKSVKRLTLGFLGARTAFGLFKKYMSEYSSQNEEFAQKMQLTTNVITTALAPAFEFFGNVIQYVVIGLARVVELLFGVNILGKTMDTSLKNASKSAKELNDNLSGLDEISNIDQSAGGLSTGIGGQLDALNDFQKKAEEVKALFNKWGIPEKIQKIKKFISDLWNSTPMKLIRDTIGDIVNWSIEHPDAVVTILGGMEVVNLISKIMGSESAGTGLLGLSSTLGALSIMAPIALGVYLVYEADKYMDKLQAEIDDSIEKIKDHIEKRKIKIDEIIDTGNSAEAQKIFDKKLENYNDMLKKLEDLNSKVNNSWYMFAVEKTRGKSGVEELKKDLSESQEIVKAINDEFKRLNDSNLITPQQQEQYKNLILQQLDFGEAIGYSKDEMSDLVAEYLNLDNSAKTLDSMVGYMKDLGYTEDEVREKLQPYFDDLYKGTYKADKKIGDMGKNVYEIFAKDYNLNIKTDDTEIKNTKSKISSIFSNPFKLMFNTDTSSIKSALTSAFSGYTNIFKFLGIKLPSYDVGTDYVPRDQIAMIHEGERIIPKKYNNSQYMGNAETNSLLMELNRNVLELANKPTTLNVNGKELAKATYSDYQEESSRRGSNMSVRRV